MHRLVRPNPVAAMLDMVWESWPSARARSFTWPVAALASFQQNSKLARWISSSNCASVPSNAGPVGGEYDCEFAFTQFAIRERGGAARPLPHSLRISLRVLVGRILMAKRILL